MQQWGDSYWETYSPVVNMLSVRLILAIAKLHNLDSKAIDFVFAFPQADLEEDIWMYLPIGFQVDGHTEKSSERRYLLKLNESLYGLKQGSYNCTAHKGNLVFQQKTKTRYASSLDHQSKTLITLSSQ